MLTSILFWSVLGSYIWHRKIPGALFFTVLPVVIGLFSVGVLNHNRSLIDFQRSSPASFFRIKNARLKCQIYEIAKTISTR